MNPSPDPSPSVSQYVIPGPQAVAASVANFHSAMKPLLTAPQPKILLDFCQVEFVDSTFIGALIVTLKRVAERGGVLKLSGLQTPMRQLFDVLRFYRVFDVYDSPECALKAFDSESKT